MNEEKEGKESKKTRDSYKISDKVDKLYIQEIESNITASLLLFQIWS